MSLETGQSRRRSHPKLRAALAVVLAVVLICAAAFAVYVNIYYHGEPAAVQAMDSDSAVSVYELRNGVTVFAPEDPSAGLIFYPGGKVEHTAYVPLLRTCAERGVLCVLVRMSFNLAVFNVNGANGIPEQFPGVEYWYLGGHYGAQAGDGTPTISSDEQIDRTAGEITRIMLTAS